MEIGEEWKRIFLRNLPLEELDGLSRHSDPIFLDQPECSGHVSDLPCTAVSIFILVITSLI